MSRVLSGIIPDEAVFADFRRQALSTDNWYSKYDKNGMEVWVEVAPVTSPQGNKNVPKVHKIKVRKPWFDSPVNLMHCNVKLTV